MIFDDLGWSLMNFRNHDFFDDFTKVCHMYHLEESASHPLPLLEGVPQVNQMKHSRHEPPSFLMYYHMVFTRVIESCGVYWNPSTFSENHEKS